MSSHLLRPFSACFSLLPSLPRRVQKVSHGEFRKILEVLEEEQVIKLERSANKAETVRILDA